MHRKVIEHDVTKILTFVDWQKLKAARRVDSLYAKYPDLDQTEANPHRHFIENQAALIEQKASILWGFEPHGRMRNRLDHWSARVSFEAVEDRRRRHRSGRHSHPSPRLDDYARLGTEPTGK